MSKNDRNLRVWLSEGEFVYGDFPWTFARQLFGYGLISDYKICDVGDSNWLPIADHKKVGVLPKSVRSRIEEYLKIGQFRLLFPWEVEFLKKLGCPPIRFQLNRYISRNLISDLISDKPNVLSKYERWVASILMEYGVRMEPITEGQKKYLESCDPKLDVSITRGEFETSGFESATEAQLRRLKFYKCPDLRFTKREASEIIDSYLERFPESEERYQTWKKQMGLR